MSYYHAKRTAVAKAWLNLSESETAERNAKRRKRTEERLNYWRAWLQDHLAQPRKTRVDWRPRYAFEPPKEVNDYGETIIEGEFTELADAATSGGVCGIGSAQGEATQGIEPAAPSGASESQGEGWAEEAYPQDGARSEEADRRNADGPRPGRPHGPNSRLEPAADA